MQIKISAELHERIKAVVDKRGIYLNEFILKLLATAGDEKLKALAEKELKERPKRGRPW